MYFWNINMLKEDIKSGNFGDKEAIVYIVISLALYSIGLELVSLLPMIENYNLWDYVNSFLSVLVPVLGTIYAYKKNGGDEGKDFANKYFSIGFVMGIRFLVYFIGVIVLLIIYWSYVFPNNEEMPTTFVEVLLFFIWYVALYFQIAKHIEEIR